MNQNAQYRVEQSLVQFVTEFNSENRYKEFPIVAFQFVSLDDVTDGKMVWWNFLHKDVAEKYLQALTKFTGKASPDGKIKNTLINWEYEDGSFMYHDFNSESEIPIVPSFIQDDFNNITWNIDKSGVEREPAIRNEKIKLLTKWKTLLGKAFDNMGSTMWVSIPHKDHNGLAVIYSSVFCLFNKSINAKCQLPVARLIRNFIVDYLIDLYRIPLLTQKQALERTVTDLADKENIKATYFQPKKYNVQYNKPNSKKVQKVIRLDDHYFVSATYLPSLMSERTKALDRIKETYKDGKFEQDKPYLQAVDYVAFRNISVLNDEQVQRFFYGRFLVLCYHTVFEKTVHETYELIFNTGPRNDDFIDVAEEIQSRFLIRNLKSDKRALDKSHIRHCILEKLIPAISDAEFDFLKDVCDAFHIINPNLVKVKKNIQEARKMKIE